MEFAASRQYSHREKALHLPQVNARASGEAPRIRRSFRVLLSRDFSRFP